MVKDVTMSFGSFSRTLMKTQRTNSSQLKLDHGSRVAVIGGGPAGSLFSYFLLDMAERIDLTIHVDIYEPRDFAAIGPNGCNMCGGVIYESLVQSLAVEGINLPTSVVQRGIEFNMLHMDVGSIQIQTARHEKRIATTFRGAGPRGCDELQSTGLDNYLLQVAIAKGARHISSRVIKAEWFIDEDLSDQESKLIQIKTPGGLSQTYELLAVTSGVNTAILKHFQDMDFGYKSPQTTKLLVREYYLGEKEVSKYIGPVFHGFLLNIPGLDYGAIIPKGDFVTVCLLSSHGDLDSSMMDTFMDDPTVKCSLPPGFSPENFTCNCSPRINVMGCSQPFGDRIVFIGDSGVSRLYKDGIGGAYRTSKIAANTAIFQGISENDFRKHYLPFCRKIETDNRIGKFIFKAISKIQTMEFARRAILRMVTNEQQGQANAEIGMSMVMWDMLTGGALYRDVLGRVLNPAFWSRFLWNISLSLLPLNRIKLKKESTIDKQPSQKSEPNKMEMNAMDKGMLGKIYQNGEIIVRQGEIGDCMYVIQDGYVEVVIDSEVGEVQLNIMGKDEFFGEMAIFEHEIRTATVRALGPARILTVDHKNFLQRIHEDPSLAYRVMNEMSRRIRRLSEEVARQHVKQLN
jgi:flavin-dependent dehydrogenase